MPTDTDISKMLSTSPNHRKREGGLEFPMRSIHRSTRNSSLCILVISLIGCSGTLQKNISKVTGTCKFSHVDGLEIGTADPLSVAAVNGVRIADSSNPPAYPDPLTPCNDEQAEPGAKEGSEGFVVNIKAGFAEAKKSFCPTFSEISESYLALVRSQQDFCRESNVKSRENQKPHNSDRDIFRGLDGVLLKIIPFYIFSH